MKVIGYSIDMDVVSFQISGQAFGLALCRYIALNDYAVIAGDCSINLVSIFIPVRK